MKMGEVAMPDAFVTALAAPPANVPLAPVCGAPKVTVTPFIGAPVPSFTVTDRGLGKGVLTGVL